VTGAGLYVLHTASIRRWSTGACGWVRAARYGSAAARGLGTV